MANEEIKYLHVKNTSVRLVHLGGVAIPPEIVAAVVDDTNGINRSDVESSPWLKETDEEITPGFEPLLTGKEADEAAKPKAKTKVAAASTPTGTGWNAKG